MDIKRPGSFGLHAQKDLTLGVNSSEVTPDVRPSIPATDSFLEDRQSGDATFKEQVRRDEKDSPSGPVVHGDVDRGLIDALLRKIRRTPPAGKRN